MSGFDHIRRAQEFAKTRNLEYKDKCVTFLRKFCEDFAKFLEVTSCGKDVRNEGDRIEQAEDQLSYVDPPWFDGESAAVRTRITLRVIGQRQFDVAVWYYADSFLIQTMKREFNDKNREEAFLHMKNALVEKEDDLDGKLERLY